MTMDEFIAVAKSQGWAPSDSHAGQPNDEVNFADGAGRMIVAYPQPTRFSDHIGFRGGNYGLVEVWKEGSLEQAILEGQDIDNDVDGAEVTEALAEVMAYYDPEPDGADGVRQELSEIGGRGA